MYIFWMHALVACASNTVLFAWSMSVMLAAITVVLRDRDNLDLAVRMVQCICINVTMLRTAMLRKHYFIVNIVAPGKSICFIVYCESKRLQFEL